MEEVEQGSRVAVESSHKVLNLLTQPNDELKSRNLMGETKEFVSWFKRVVSMFGGGGRGGGGGHARVRRVKQPLLTFDQKAFSNSLFVNPPQLLDSNAKTPHQFPHQTIRKAPVFDVNPLKFISNSPSAHLQFFQQLIKQWIQLQQQHLNFKVERFRRSNSSINLKFDGSPTVSTTSISFMSSHSMDGSMASMDGKTFHLIGGTQLFEPGHQHRKRRCIGRGEDTSGKCATSIRCHCTKRRKLRVKRSIKVPEC